MTTPLVSDILHEIFLHLSHRDLYKCIFVNWLWCESAIPILWEDPMLDSKTIQTEKLLLAYFSQIEDSDRLILYETHKIDLPNIQKPSKFPYSAFVKKFRYTRMLEFIEIFCTARGIKDQKGPYLLMRSILKAFLKAGARLRELKIEPSVRNVIDEEALLWTEIEFRPIIQSVKIMEIRGVFPKYLFLAQLSKICKEVESLTIEVYASRTTVQEQIASSLALFISSQTSLFKLSILGIRSHSSYILHSLLSQRDHLRYLNFQYVDFIGCPLWAGLAECEKLEFLQIYDYSNLSNEVVEPLMNASFPNLMRIRIVPASSSQWCYTLQRFEREMKNRF
ncbi:hypothetical protein G9A89_009361 [Geosiphon pyriformis]|nr:hypothetical protein G9A89_009361 [Geosiphon pyriformis]